MNSIKLKKAQFNLAMTEIERMDPKLASVIKDYVGELEEVYKKVAGFLPGEKR